MIAALQNRHCECHGKGQRSDPDTADNHDREHVKFKRFSLQFNNIAICFPCQEQVCVNYINELSEILRQEFQTARHIPEVTGGKGV